MKLYAEEMREVTAKAIEDQLISHSEKMKDIYDKIKKAAEEGCGSVELCLVPIENIKILTNNGFSIYVYREYKDIITEYNVCDLRITWAPEEQK